MKKYRLVSIFSIFIFTTIFLSACATQDKPDGGQPSSVASLIQSTQVAAGTKCGNVTCSEGCTCEMTGPTGICTNCPVPEIPTFTDGINTISRDILQLKDVIATQSFIDATRNLTKSKIELAIAAKDPKAYLTSYGVPLDDNMEVSLTSPPGIMRDPSLPPIGEFSCWYICTRDAQGRLRCFTYCFR